MTYQQGASAVWFGKGQHHDAQTLQAWRDAPLTYFPDQDLDHHWNVDRYEVILGHDESGELFQRAAYLTLNNRFYPSEIMSTVSDYALEGRPVQRGDRVLQRIRVLQWRGLPILELLTLNEITEVIDEPRKVGFTYTTTHAHSEVGEWSPTVTWQENGNIVLTIEVVSRLRPGASRAAQDFARQLQIRAHKVSIQNFIDQLSGSPTRASQSAKPGMGDLVPALLATLAFGLILKAIRSHGQKKSAR